MLEALRFDCLVEVLTGGFRYGDVWRRACWLEDERRLGRHTAFLLGTVVRNVLGPGQRGLGPGCSASRCGCIWSWSARPPASRPRSGRCEPSFLEINLVPAQRHDLAGTHPGVKGELVECCEHLVGRCHCGGGRKAQSLEAISHLTQPLARPATLSIKNRVAVYAGVTRITSVNSPLYLR